MMMAPKVSQSELANALGVTFQQIQKYEKGVNRLSAAMMVRIAEVLNVDVQYFFDELPTGAKNNREIKTPVVVDMSIAAHGPRLMNAFLKLKNDELRGAVADLAQALAGQADIRPATSPLGDAAPSALRCSRKPRQGAQTGIDCPNEDRPTVGFHVDRMHGRSAQSIDKMRRGVGGYVKSVCNTRSSCGSNGSRSKQPVLWCVTASS